VAVANGSTVAEACIGVGISAPTYYRWRRNTAEQPDTAAARAAMLDAAKRVFLRDGFQATLESIALEAGVARQTLYNQFASKEQLFEQIVLDVQGRLARPVLQVERNLAPRDVLLAHARAFAHVVLDPEAIALFRVALAEYRKQPRLGRISYDLRTSEAIPKFTTLLAAYLTRLMREHVIVAGDAELMAESYLSAVMGYDRIRLLAGISFSGTSRLEARMQLATDLFLAGVQRAKPSN